MYDPEKYREKREKVLGIRKRSLGFGAVSIITALIILSGMGIVTVPQALSWLGTRHLDDAIYKLESEDKWPVLLVSRIEDIHGVKKAHQPEGNHTRLVVTFDRRMLGPEQIGRVMENNKVKYTLLNRINHRQHMATMKNEEESVETP